MDVNICAKSKTISRVNIFDESAILSKLVVLPIIYLNSSQKHHDMNENANHIPNPSIPGPAIAAPPNTYSNFPGNNASSSQNHATKKPKKPKKQTNRVIPVSHPSMSTPMQSHHPGMATQMPILHPGMAFYMPPSNHGVPMNVPHHHMPTYASHQKHGVPTTMRTYPPHHYHGKPTRMPFERQPCRYGRNCHNSKCTYLH